jgi:hypothetical protein
MLGNILETHWEAKKLDGNTMVGAVFGTLKIKKTYNQLEINFGIIFENKLRVDLSLNLKPKVLIKVGLVRPRTVGQKNSHITS